MVLNTPRIKHFVLLVSAKNDVLIKIDGGINQNVYQFLRPFGHPNRTHEIALETTELKIKSMRLKHFFG